MVGSFSLLLLGYFLFFIFFFHFLFFHLGPSHLSLHQGSSSRLLFLSLCVYVCVCVVYWERRRPHPLIRAWASFQFLRQLPGRARVCLCVNVKRNKLRRNKALDRAPPTGTVLFGFRRVEHIFLGGGCLVF